MKLYVFALAARRMVDDQYEIGVSTAIVLNETEERALEEGSQVALDVFPESEGWRDQAIMSQEIPQKMAFTEGYILRWQADKVSEDTEALNG